MIKKYFKKYDSFLKWWLIFTLCIVATFISIITGLADTVNKADITKISFLIYTLFYIFSLNTGRLSKKFCENDSIDKEVLKRKNEPGWFISDILLTLGMIGTVIGFIYMLSTSFEGLKTTDLNSVKEAITQMSAGMGTALYTTASGLVCSLILKLQLFIFEQDIDKDYEEKDEKIL